MSASNQVSKNVIGKYVGFGFLAKVIDSGFRDYYKTHLDESDLGLTRLVKEYNAGGIDVVLYIFDGTMDVVLSGYNDYGELEGDFLVLGVSQGGNISFDDYYETRFMDKDKSIPNFELKVLEYEEDIANTSLISASLVSEDVRQFHEDKRTKYREFSEHVVII